MKGRWFIPLFIGLIILTMVWGGGVVMAKNDPFCTSTGFGPDTANPKVNSALGCIPVRIDQFMVWLLPLVFSIVGGISFLLMIYGFILMTTSAGDPKAVQGAQETISSAIMGLIVCIFAVFILRLIAVGILQIPGL